VGVDHDPANNRRIISWTKEYWNALHPILGRRGLRKLHDGRGRGPHQGNLP
jgi:hypothetical protein